MTVVFVILTIAFFLGLDWLLQRRRRAAPALAPARAALPPRLPRGVFFARSHTWLSLFPSGRAWLGVDDFVAGLLERPRLRALKAPGQRVARGEPLVAIEEEDGRTLTVPSPVAAQVVAVNPAPATGAGGGALFDAWVVELEPERLSELKTFLLGEETGGWIREEVRRLRDVLAGGPPGLAPALQDGGLPAPGAMKHADAQTWKRFEREFLEVR